MSAKVLQTSCYPLVKPTKGLLPSLSDVYIFIRTQHVDTKWMLL